MLSGSGERQGASRSLNQLASERLDFPGLHDLAYSSGLCSNAPIFANLSQHLLIEILTRSLFIRSGDFANVAPGGLKFCGESW